MTHFLSASQLTLYTECERKWGFKYLDYLKTEQKPAAALGDEVETTQLQPYFETNRPLDFTRPSGEIACSALPLLPKQGTPITLQRAFKIPTLRPDADYVFIGKIDWFVADSIVVPGLEPGVRVVGDFKTTSDFKWAKSEDTLARDIQAQLYAMAVMFEDNVDTVDLAWTYMKTRKPYRAKRVHLRVTGAHVVEQFQRIDEIAARVAAIRNARPQTLDLKPNPFMCDAFGGCPYKHLCNLSPAQISPEPKMGNANMNFLDSLKAKSGAPPAAPAPVASAPPPVEAPLPAWADPAKTNADGTPVMINPPEAALPPPAAVAAPVAEPAKRTRRTKVEMEAAAGKPAVLVETATSGTGATVTVEWSRNGAKVVSTIVAASATAEAMAAAYEESIKFIQLVGAK